MRSPCSNAFHRSRPLDLASVAGHPRGTLASMLRPLRATLESDNATWTLMIAPMHPIDALAPWREIDAGRNARTLVLDGDTPKAGALVVDDDALSAVLTRQVSDRSHLVRIEGEVEASDVSAIQRGLAKGRSALESEIRASASMRMSGDRCLQIQTHRADVACGFVAESFRQYVAALRNRPIPDIAPPEPWQIERLLTIDGGLSVRPLETELYSTFVDIGICVGADGPASPATLSLIYDVYGNSWHGEE